MVIRIGNLTSGQYTLSYDSLNTEDIVVVDMQGNKIQKILYS